MYFPDFTDDDSNDNNTNHDIDDKYVNMFYDIINGYRKVVSFIFLLMVILTFGLNFNYNGSIEYYKNYKSKNYTILEYYDVEFINVNFPTHKSNNGTILLITYDLSECNDDNNYTQMIMRDSIYSKKNIYYNGQNLTLSYDCATKNVIFSNVTDFIEHKEELYNLIRYPTLVMMFHINIIVIIEFLIYKCIEESKKID